MSMRFCATVLAMLWCGMIAVTAAAPPPWHAAEARYRLTLEAEEENAPLYFDFAEWVLPEALSGGIAVYDGAGKSVGFEYTASGRILLDAAPGRVRYLYWGGVPLPGRGARQAKGNLERLHLRILDGRNLFPTAGEWLENRNRWTNRGYQRQWERNNQMVGILTLAYGAFPTRYVRCNPDFWVIRNQIMKARRLAEQIRQNRIRGRRRLHRLWCGTDAPYWFMPLQQKYLRDRLLGAMRNYRNIDQRWSKNLKDNRKNSIGAPERELLARFANARTRVQGDGAVREIVLPKRPFDSGGDFLTRFSGRLQITRAGEYAFTITSNATILWKIDGKVVLRHFGRSDPKDVRPATVRLPLTAGAHEFELIYHKWKVTTDLTVTWRGPGETAFRLLDDTAFAPAREARVTALESRGGRAFFKMRRRSRYLLSLDKESRAELVEFEPAETGGFRWKLPDGTTSPEKQQVLALRTAGEGERERAELIPDDIRLPRMALGEYRAPETPFLALDPEIDMRLELPLVLYQDENLAYRVVFFSDLPLAVQYLWTTETSRELNSFASARRSVTMGGKVRSERFAAGATAERGGGLSGHELADGAEVAMTFGVPGEVFATERVLFAPVTGMPEGWRSTAEGWRDGEGRRVVPVVNRMTLNRLRGWELPQRLWAKMRSSGLLVIAPEFGGLGEMLRQSAVARGEKLTFVPWTEDGEGGNVWMDSLPAMWEKLGHAEASRVVVVLPAESPNRLAEWERERMVAMMLNRLRQNGAVREIYVTTMIPPEGVEAGEAWYPQQVAREYEAKRGYWWERLGGTRDWYEAGRGDAERNRMPVGAVEALVEKFWLMF